MLTMKLIVNLQFRSCFDITLICFCLRNFILARFFIVNFSSFECFVHCWRLTLNWSHAFVQMLIVVFDFSTIIVSSDCHSWFFIVWSILNVILTKCSFFSRRLTTLNAFLNFCKSFKRSLILCKIETTTLITLATMLKESIMWSLLLLMKRFKCNRQSTFLNKSLFLCECLECIHFVAFDLFCMMRRTRILTNWID